MFWPTVYKSQERYAGINGTVAQGRSSPNYLVPVPGVCSTLSQNFTPIDQLDLHAYIGKQELSYCRGWPTVREQLKRLCLHRRCVEYLATGNFYLLA